jgi:hypothetical protein
MSGHIVADVLNQHTPSDTPRPGRTPWSSFAEAGRHGLSLVGASLLRTVSGLAVVVTGSIIVPLGVAVVIPLTTEMLVCRPGLANRENPTRTVSVLNGKGDVHDRVLANRGSQPT